MRGERTAVLLILLAGCSTHGFEESHRIHPQELQNLIDAAPFPEKTPAILPGRPAATETRPDGRRVVRLDLREALRLALRNNLRYLVEGEALEIQLLTLEVLRHGWQPTIDPLTGSFTYTTSPDATRTLTQSATLAVSQRMPYGGEVGASWTHTGSQPSGRDAYTGTGTVFYTQPLLRGGGRRVATEELVLGERGYVYNRRLREFNRVLLHVQTVEGYFGLLQREQQIRNFERNLDRARKQSLQTQIQERFGRVTRTDVFRSQLQVTRAEGELLDQREQIKIARDAFKIDLAIPPHQEFDLVPETIEYRPLSISPEEAVAAALENNPAWLNTRDRVEDAHRGLAIASNATLPRFDVTTAYSWRSEDEKRLWDNYDMGSRDLTVTGSLEIPIDRFGLRRDYQKAVIAARQADRDFLRARDAVVRDVNAQLIQLRQAELAMQFQLRAISDAEKTARLAEFDYLRGRQGSSNRDVIEAQDQLLLAQNAYQAALVAARISQLRLMQFIGRLVIDAEGRWLTE